MMSKVPKYGDHGPEVGRLQRRLMALGYTLPKYGDDDNFGDETRDAVIQWQRDHHADGVLDEVEYLDLFPPEREGERPKPPHGQKEIMAIYGRPWDDVDAWRAKWLTPCVLPGPLKRLTKHGKIWVNKDIAPILEVVFAEIVAKGLAHEIKTFDGCWSVRKMRGGGSWSTHAWALAIDLNAATNGLGRQPRMNPVVVEIFKKHGFKWGGEFGRKDGMHFQFATGT